MKKFLCLTTVHHDGKVYEAGAIIELADAAAAQLLAVNAIETAPQKAPEKSAKT